MVEYSVVLKRHKKSTRSDVCVFRDEDRELAISEMQKYVKKNGFTVYDHDGRFTVADVVLIEKEPIVGAPTISVKSYIEIFDECGDKRR